MSFLPQPLTLQSIFGQNRVIGPITVQTIINEETNDTLTITKQPVQQGASITDHAYLEPTVLTMTILQQEYNPISQLVQTFSGGGLSQIYQEFLALQSSRQPFNVLTPKRVYTDMLMSVLRCTTDKSTENILSLNVSFQQVFIVSVGTARVPPSRQASPKKTAATQKTGPQSVISSVAQAVGISQ